MGQEIQIRFDTGDPNCPGNDLFCAVLAELAYKSQPEIERALKAAGYLGTDVLFITDRLASCLILRWDDVTAVAFKGMSTSREWLNNLNARLQPTNFGRVHAGFLHTIEQVGPVLYSLLHQDLHSGAKIVLTGHSRGGALATLFVVYLALQGHRAHYVVTFGSPRVGDKKFASLWGHVSDEPVGPVRSFINRSYVMSWLLFLISWPFYWYWLFPIARGMGWSFYGGWIQRITRRVRGTGKKTG
jgi:hypothetical protein